MPTPYGMITVAQAARRLGRSIEQVRRYLREGKLEGERIGQQWFIDESSLQRDYPAARAGFRPVRESAPVMEATEMGEKEMSKEEFEALIDEIEANREAIRRRLGHGFDVVQLIRQSREGP